MRWWFALIGVLFVPYALCLWFTEHDLAEAYCGLLAAAGLGAALFNLRRRDQVRRAGEDLEVLSNVYPDTVTENDRRRLCERSEDGVLGGLLLSSYSAILIAFVRPLGHLLDRLFT